MNGDVWARKSKNTASIESCRLYSDPDSYGENEGESDYGGEGESSNNSNSQNSENSENEN